MSGKRVKALDATHVNGNGVKVDGNTINKVTCKVM